MARIRGFEEVCARRKGAPGARGGWSRGSCSIVARPDACQMARPHNKSRDLVSDQPPHVTHLVISHTQSYSTFHSTPPGHETRVDFGTMTTRWTLAVALACIVALASVPGGDALWGKKKTLEAKATPSPDPVQEPAPAVVVGDAEPRAAEEPAHQTEQQDPAPAAQADLPTHYWHNAVTGESLWNYPNYEAKDGACPAPCRGPYTGCGAFLDSVRPLGKG